MQIEIDEYVETLRHTNTGLYMQIGADVNADGEVVPVFCVMDEATHEQIGESFSTAHDAVTAIVLVDFMQKKLA